jgi:WD40 repeat protein
MWNGSLASHTDSVLSELWAEGCAFRAFFSPDAELVYAVNVDPLDGVARIGVFDTGTGDLLVDFTNSRYAGPTAAFSPDGTDLIVGPDRLYVLDVATLRSGGSIDETVRLEMTGHEARVLRMVVSPDGSMAATGSPNEPVKLWNFTTGRLIAEFGGITQFPHDGVFHPTRPWLLVTSPPNEIRIYTLDIDELVEIAESRLSRDMTEDECQQYFREPCPGP